MNTLLNSINVEIASENMTDLMIGNTFINHTVSTWINEANEAPLLLATLTVCQDYVSGCDLKVIKPAARAEWLREQMKAWHSVCIRAATNYDDLVFPEPGQNQRIGSFVTTGKPTKANPTGTVSMGKTLRSFVSKLCAVFASTNGKSKIAACKNTTDVAGKYSALRKPTNSDALRKVQAEVFEGLRFKDDTVISAKNLMALRKVFEAIAADHMEAIPVQSEAA
jgi:hypothetical protein